MFSILSSHRITISFTSVLFLRQGAQQGRGRGGRGGGHAQSDGTRLSHWRCLEPSSKGSMTFIQSQQKDRFRRRAIKPRVRVARVLIT